MSSLWHGAPNSGKLEITNFLKNGHVFSVQEQACSDVSLVTKEPTF